MTVIYWAAAAAALSSATGAACELVRDRLPAVAAWALSMMAIGISLALVAVDPDVLHGDAGPASWACAGVGILGTWAFAEVLASGAGDTRRVADMMTIPLLGSGCAMLLLCGLHWAGRHGICVAGSSGIPALMTQLTLLIYYVPGLGRIAVLARRRASLTPRSWGRSAMWALCGAAGAEVILALARSAVLATHAVAPSAVGSAITMIAILQGIAAICGVGALAVGPVVMLVAARCESWLA